MSLKKCWLKCLWLQKIDDFFQETHHIVKVLPFRSSLCQPIWQPTNLTVVHKQQDHLILTNQDVVKWTTCNIFVCLDWVCVRFRLTKSLSLFIYSQKSDDEKMNHCNSCEHYCVNVHTDRTVCVCHSFHRLMYVMKKSSEILFQFFLQARWQIKIISNVFACFLKPEKSLTILWSENIMKHCLNIDLIESNRLIQSLTHCWLLRCIPLTKQMNKEKSNLKKCNEIKTQSRALKTIKNRVKQKKTKTNKQKQTKTYEEIWRILKKMKNMKKMKTISSCQMIQKQKFLHIEMQKWMSVWIWFQNLIDDLLIEQSRTIADMRNCWLINWTSLNQ